MTSNLQIRINDPRSPDASPNIRIGGLEIPWDGSNVDVYVSNILRYTVEFTLPNGEPTLTTTHALWSGEAPVYEVKEHNDPELYEELG